MCWCAPPPASARAETATAAPYTWSSRTMETLGAVWGWGRRVGAGFENLGGQVCGDGAGGFPGASARKGGPARGAASAAAGAPAAQLGLPLRVGARGLAQPQQPDEHVLAGARSVLGRVRGVQQPAGSSMARPAWCVSAAARSTRRAAVAHSHACLANALCTAASPPAAGPRTPGTSPTRRWPSSRAARARRRRAAPVGGARLNGARARVRARAAGRRPQRPAPR
jgi:hypothetical protein